MAGVRRRFSFINRCPHTNLIGIYGDAINHCGGYRLWCSDCKRYINGQVDLAHIRSEEKWKLSMYEKLRTGPYE